MTLIDTNILLDIVTNDPKFADWSLLQLEKASLSGSIFINDIIYAELSVRYALKENLDEFVDGIGLERQSIPSSALFLAGKAFLDYKQAGGHRTNVLPDFFIGAHAAVTQQTLLTRDKARYQTYFPSVELITP